MGDNDDTLEYLQTATKHGARLVKGLDLESTATGGCAIKGLYTYDVKNALRRQLHAHWDKAQCAWVTVLSVLQVKQLFYPGVKVVPDDLLVMLKALQPGPGPAGYISTLLLVGLHASSTTDTIFLMDYDDTNKAMYKPVFDAIRAAGFHYTIHQNYD